MKLTFSIYMIPPLLTLSIGLTLSFIAIIKAKIHSENILFALTCLWWSFLAPLFICHHLTSDQQLLMTIERYVHFFYVYLPAVNLLFLFRILDQRKPYVIACAFTLSFLISLTTFSDLYIHGLYQYSWGYMAKGGPFLQIFGAYCMVTTIYICVLSFMILKRETNKIVQIKIKYIIFGFVCSAVLTLFNIPAMNGIDVYPLGNLMFIPLAIMSYGVLRYKMMGIKTLLHVSAMWLMVSSLLLIPNYLLFRLLITHYTPNQPIIMFIMLIIWFFADFFYLQTIQPKIDRLFNKEKYNLRFIESQFIENISYLKNLSDLISQFRDVLQKTLSFPTVDFYTRQGEGSMFENQSGETWQIDGMQERWFSNNNHLIERDMVKTHPHYLSIRDSLIRVFDDKNCQYIVPVFQNQTLTHMLFIPEKSNFKQITPEEVRFINAIRASASIALANSTMFQNISNLKKHLEKQSVELKEEIAIRKQTEKELSNHKNHLEELVRNRTIELEEKNEQIIGSIRYARKIQQAILPDNADIQSILPEHFVFFKPRDIVSGDFFWFYRGEGKTLIAVVDCTGHGVPGAFMSMIGTSLLNKIVSENQIYDPPQILEHLNAGVIQALKQENTEGETQDGMDVCLCLLEDHSNTLIFSGAGRPLFYIKNDAGKTDDLELIVFKGDHLGIGGRPRKNQAPFNRTEIEISTGDILYLTTDGFVDQANSEGKKFGSKQFRSLLKSIASMDMNSQRENMNQRFENHKNQEEQRDDITVIGIKI